MLSRVALVLGSIVVVSPALGTEDTLAEYGSLPAIPCPTISHPPSESEAALLITCSLSYDRFQFAQVIRVYDARVEMDAARDYTYGDPGEADPSGRIYPIRTYFTQSTCAPIANREPGKSCNEIDFAGISICYRLPPGAWTCTAGGSKTAARDGVPPPRY